MKLILLILLTLGAVGCTDKGNFQNFKLTEVKEVKSFATKSHVQHAKLNMQQLQLEAVLSAHSLTAYDKYKHDDKQLEDGNRQSGTSDYDYWSTDKLAKVKILRDAIKQYGAENVKEIIGYDTVYVDCDDTGIMLYMALVDAGYPRDQLYWNVYLCPPSELAGISGDKWDYHFVLSVEVEGLVPITMEDIYPHYTDVDPKLFETYEGKQYINMNVVEKEERYYHVMSHHGSDDIKYSWYYTDKEGFELFEKGKLSYEDAINRPAYIKHRLYVNKVYNRVNYAQ